MMPDTWDTQPPLNIDDDQIWPGMAEMPQEKQGATDMIFCLSRACLGKYASGSLAAKKDSTGTPSKGPLSFFASSSTSGLYKSFGEAEEMIAQAEREVEERFLRYCDVVNPLHYLTMCSARCGITAMRLKIRLPRAMNKEYTPTDAERKEVFQLTQKILDTDAALCGHPGLKRFRWHVRFFSLWGTWDSLIFVLTSLCRRGSDGGPLLSVAETTAAWKSVQQLYENHEELLVSKRALYLALSRLTVKAWTTNQSVLLQTDGIGNSESTLVGEPGFITSLRSLWKRRRPGEQHHPKKTASEEHELQTGSVPGPPLEATSSTDMDFLGSSGASSMDLDFASLDFDLEAADWAYWDDLIKDR
jgi:hypothetical protein